jgi:hypothetical protein
MIKFATITLVLNIIIVLIFTACLSFVTLEPLSHVLHWSERARVTLLIILFSFNFINLMLADLAGVFSQCRFYK